MAVMICFLVCIVQSWRGSAVKYIRAPGMNSWSTGKIVLEMELCRNSLALCGSCLVFLNTLGLCSSDQFNK